MKDRKICILWIGAHPDDEAQVGGTLAKFARSGHRVVICVVSKAEKGHMEIPPDELVKVRDKEMAEAAKILGAEYYGNLGLPDQEVFVTNELVHQLTEVMRQVSPDIVITHWERDYSPDHINTSIAVTHAVLTSQNPCYKTETPGHWVQRLYYADTSHGLDFEPDFWIDISDTIEIKLRAFAAHKSQMEWLGIGGRDPLETARVHARFRGIQANTMYAEAFRSTRRGQFVHAELGYAASLTTPP